MKKIRVIGGGLAGPEAALQAASRNCLVDLYEMRPHRSTEAHQTSDFAELVCSNSLKSESENSAPWLLKQEMRAAGSFLLADADATAVPAGHALAVDRVVFSARVAERLEAHPNITIHREEVTSLDSDADLTILASGPLTSKPLTDALQQITGADQLAFYDSISPIVDASTIDMDKVYFAARWDKGSADYINCPFTKEEYDAFIDALTSAEHVESKEWENLQYFEGCLPIEETARRGRDTLRFGPMKPAGLTNPKTGRWPYAAVQLRCENLRADSYNLVGFQNHLKFGEQARILRMIPDSSTRPSCATARFTATRTFTRLRCSPRRCNSERGQTCSSPASFPGSRATPSRSPRACWPESSPPTSSRAARLLRLRGVPRTAR
jgi:methylenetetrahydrofolate--tRNA-(uracil-5-)-methyltransferase